MPSLRDIRRKIKSVRSTQQVTRAMKMVSAARMRRAQTAILNARPFAFKMGEMVSHLTLQRLFGERSYEERAETHPFFRRRKSDSAGLVLVTSDKGLCGPFNAGLIRASVEWLEAYRDRKIHAAVVGKKGRNFLWRLAARGGAEGSETSMDVMLDLVGIFPKVRFAHAEILGKAIMDAYLERNLSSVDVIFNEFVSVGIQRVATMELLPLSVPAGRRETLPLSEEFLFEPERPKLLEALLPRYIKARLYRILLESQAAELAARMNAMDSATRNAGELLDDLTVRLNRTRQAMITSEIAELVGGAEALAR